MPPLITLEEHFLSEAIGDTPQYVEQFKHVPSVKDKLHDLGPLRLSEMEKGRVSLQIISHGPALPSVSQAHAANSQLHAAVQKNPTRFARFAGFAVLPMGHPSEAAQELRRCIKDLGFVGALVDNHANGTYYDGTAYLPFWKEAESLDVPIYLHPTWPTAQAVDMLYTGNFTPGAGTSMGSSGFGWHSDTALHILRLYASGLFDACPKLKVIIGHMGEMLPFQLERICFLSGPRWGDIERKFRQVWDENIWITVSGMFSLSPFACTIRNTKVDHILYSVDYPFAKNEAGLQFMEELRGSGLVGEEEFEMIAYKNAESLLGVKAPARG